MALLLQPGHPSVCAVCHAHIRTSSHLQHQSACFNNNLDKIDTLGLTQCQHDYHHIVTLDKLDDHELRSCEHIRSRMRLVASGLVRALRDRNIDEYDKQVDIIKAEQERIRSNLYCGRRLVKQLQKQQLQEMIDAREKAKNIEKDLNNAKGSCWYRGKKRSVEVEEKERIRLYFLKRKREAEKEATTLNIPGDQIDPNNFFEPSTLNPPFQDLKPIIHFNPATIYVNFLKTDPSMQDVEIKKEKMDL